MTRRRWNAPRNLTLHAYVLLAEPEWLELSVASYYPLVERIVASYDQDHRGWTGEPIRSEECVERLRAFDADGKVEFVVGDYTRFVDPMANDTMQRQEAVALAGRGADWVLQIDTDEVLPHPDRFVDALREASTGEWEVVRYPNRVMRQHLYDSVYLEECNRLWMALGGTLPLAVRPGVTLSVARETAGRAFRVGLPRQRVFACPGRHVHMTVTTDDALIHLSWVRQREGLMEKFSSWGHSHDRDWRPVLRRWEWVAQHPALATALTPVSRMPFVGQLRPVRLNAVPAPEWEAPA